nr:hypothetical protein [Tanacetum cinerariifolium]
MGIGECEGHDDYGDDEKRETEVRVLNHEWECVFFIISSIAVQTPNSGISNLLAVGTTFTGNGNFYCQWELSPGSGHALCILFPTMMITMMCLPLNIDQNDEDADLAEE